MSLAGPFLEELRSRLTLSGVVGRRVRLTKKGREHSGLCPFHNEKTPSFTVSDDKGFYHCFGCGAHGDVISFVMNTEGLAFVEAVEKLAAEAGLEVPRASPREREAEKQRASLYDVVEAACRFFEAEMALPSGQAAKRYLEGRGLSRETIQSFRLGFAPARRGALRQALKEQGIEDAQLVEAGLVKKADDGSYREYFFDRVIFPITDRRGRVVAFGGRTLADAQPKYLNSPDTPLFHKGRLLFNLDRARLALKEGQPIIVVEGYMDAIALAQAGFKGAVAPLGTALTEDQLQELWRLTPEPLLSFDGDNAGSRAAQRALDRALPLLGSEKTLSFLFLPAGEDPDSLLQAGGAPAFKAVLAAQRPLIDVLWERLIEGRHLDRPERRAGLLKDLDATATRIADPTLQRFYRAELKERFYRLVWRRGGTPVAAPPQGGAARRSADLGRRRDEALLALMVNHPALLQEMVEQLAALQLGRPDLDRLRRALVDLAAHAPDLDSGGLYDHLSALGFGGQLDAVRHQSVYALTQAARPEAPLGAARQAFMGLLAEFAVAAARDQVKSEEERFAKEPNEENLSRVEAALRLLREAEARRHGDEI